MVLVLKNRIHGFCSFIKTSEVSLLYFYIFAIFYPIIPSYTLVFGVRFHSILGGLALVFLLLSKSFWKNFFSTKNILIFCLSTIFLVSASFLNGDLTTFSFYTLFINYFISPLYVFTMIDSYRKHKTTLNILLISGIILCVFALTEFTGFNIFSLIDNSDGLGLDHDIGKRFGLYRLESSFGQAIAFAIYLSILLLLAFYRATYFSSKKIWKECLNISIILLFNIFIVCTLSRFPIMVALLIDVFGFFMIKKRTKKYLILSSLAFIVVASLISIFINTRVVYTLFKNISEVFSGGGEENPLPYRFNLFYYATKVLTTPRYWLGGVGMNGNYSFMIVTQWTNSGGGVSIHDSFDNEYVRIIASQGFLGAIGWILYYFGFVRLFFKKVVGTKQPAFIFGLMLMLISLLNMISVARLDESRLLTLAIGFLLTSTHSIPVKNHTIVSI